MSLDDAVKRALENNNDIAVARFDPELSEQSLLVLPRATTTRSCSRSLSHNSTDTKGTNAFSGGTTVNTKRDVWNFGASAPIAATGGTLQLAFNNNKQDTNSIFTTFNPTFNSNLNLSLTQPLLRNLKIDQPRNQLRIAKKNREISDVQFHAIIVNTVANVKGYYYDLIYAVRQPRGGAPEPRARRRSCSTRTRSGSRSARWHRSTSSPRRPRWRAERST